MAEPASAVFVLRATRAFVSGYARSMRWIFKSVAMVLPLPAGPSRVTSRSRHDMSARLPPRNSGALMTISGFVAMAILMIVVVLTSQEGLHEQQPYPHSTRRLESGQGP